MPTWIILFSVIVLGSIFLGLLVFTIIRRCVHHDILKKHHDLAGFIIGTLGVLYSVFLGFTIVHAQDRYAQITSQVNKEAYLSADLYRIAGIFPEKKEEIRNAIGAYLKSVIEDEWPLMSQKKENLETLKKLEDLWKPFYNLRLKSEEDKIWFSQALQLLFDFNSARLARIYSSWNSLSVFSWIALIVGAIILVSLLFFFGTENKRAHFVLNSLFIGYIALMIFTVYTFENPFEPPQAIQPKAYEIVYNYYHENEKKLMSPEEETILPSSKNE